MSGAVTERLTRAEFRDRIGITLGALSIAVSEGRIVVSPDGLIEWPGEFDRYIRNTAVAPERFDALLAEHGGVISNPNVGHASDYNAQRARKTRTQADLHELELARKRGELIPVAEASRIFGDVTASLRERLSGLPNRLAMRLANERSADKVRDTLEREIRDILDSVADPLIAAKREVDL